MWAKITSREQLLNLPVGNMIVRYPVLNFDPMDNFDENDTERMSVRYVQANNTEVDTMNISLVLNVEIPGYGIPGFGGMFFSYEDVINSSAYWINTQNQ